METLEHVVADHPFFDGLTDDQLRTISTCALNARFDAGELIFREGGAATHMYLLREGKVSLEIFDLQRGPIVIQTLGAGDVLGWSWLVPPYQWRFDARALGATRAIALDGKCLRGKCDADPALGYEVVRRFALVLESRLQATRFQLLDVYNPRK